MRPNEENCLHFLVLSIQEELTVVYLLLEGVKKTWQFHFFVRLNNEIVLYLRHILSFSSSFSSICYKSHKTILFIMFIISIFALGYISRVVRDNIETRLSFTFLLANDCFIAVL